MNDSYDIPSEPRLSNTLYLNRPTPQSRTKMKLKKRLPPTPPDTLPVFLGLDDTVPLDDSSINNHANIYSIQQSTEHSIPYVNQLISSNNPENDDFYVMPRQENPLSCDTYNILTNTNQDNDPRTPPNPSDLTQFYATPPTFAKNFVLESNLSFDDSQDIPNISLDTVPDVIIDTSTNNDIYYSYPEQQIISVETLFFSSS
ncbi:unnamed protein product [Adineta steineri]|uniref:Uncharacterized protein n=2 Tax=Adineta steineri TaxID=433720 RepID=A0A818ML37_9BILA|nr:unnamed protein product [Adineta steineri]